MLFVLLSSQKGFKSFTWDLTRTATWPLSIGFLISFIHVCSEIISRKTFEFRWLTCRFSRSANDSRGPQFLVGPFYLFTAVSRKVHLKMCKRVRGQCMPIGTMGMAGWSRFTFFFRMIELQIMNFCALLCMPLMDWDGVNFDQKPPSCTNHNVFRNCQLSLLDKLSLKSCAAVAYCGFKKLTRNVN